MSSCYTRLLKEEGIVAQEDGGVVWKMETDMAKLTWVLI